MAAYTLNTETANSFGGGARQPPVGQGLLIREVSISDTPRATVGWTPLDEWPARRRDLYLTTHNTHNIQTSVPPVGFEPTISAGERSQTYVLDRAATGTGELLLPYANICSLTQWYNPEYLNVHHYHG